jgi:ligand-binding sensor domain-containing protein/signal transduction histidine kinase/DNA-binding response OmpR family regulator
MLKRIVYIIPLLFVVVIINAKERINFKYLTSIDGLSNNTVHDITQDKEGYIWIATIEGLNRFDGINIKTYYHKNAAGKLSGNVVTSLLASSSGKLYVGTINGLDLYQPGHDSFEPILFQGSRLDKIIRIIETSEKEIVIATLTSTFKLTKDHQINRISNLFYRDICEFQNDKIWGVTSDQIHLFNLNGEIIKTYSNLTYPNSIDFELENVECLFRDSRGIIWLGTKRSGLAYYDVMMDKFFNLRFINGVSNIEDNYIRVIREGWEGNLWIGTESGLHIYDFSKQEFRFFTQTLNSYEAGLNDKAIYSIFRSEDNTMWVGTFFGGVNYTNPSTLKFNNINADGGIEKLSGKAVSNIIETNGKKIWIATEDGGISIYDSKNNKFEYLKHSENNIFSLSSNNVHALEEDLEGNIWIGTFLGGINKFDNKNKTISKVEVLQIDNNNLLSVFCLFHDSKNRLWAGALDGLYLKDKHQFKPIYEEVFQNMFIRFVNEDAKGNIWICSNFNGLYKIEADSNIINYSRNNNNDLQSEIFTFSYIDSKQNIWFGTQDGGLVKYEPELDKFITYTIIDGLPNNTVHAITEDHDENIWFSTNKGIVKFEVDNNTFSHYNENDGLIGNQFNYNSCLRSSDSLLYFGAVNGLSFFNPGDIQSVSQKTRLHFTDFKVFNKKVDPESSSILTNHINKQQSINLNHSDNVFTIDFVGINFLAPKKIEYAYYLKGFENSWNYVGDISSATYTNLSPGFYTFRVKATDNNGQWTSDTREVNISIKPPFWQSFLGYLLYTTIGLIIIFLMIRYLRIRQKEKLKIQIADFEQQKNTAIHKNRLNFFTYISHEFKTPLSIVLATIDELMFEEEGSPKLKKYGELIKKNALKLLFLINQLMDFRKIETDHASIKLNKGDIISFIYSITDLFSPLFDKKSITVYINSNVDIYETYFDADKIEKIISNLLSNSIKAFITEESRGEISIDIKINEHNNQQIVNERLISGARLQLLIADNGPGISETQLEKLFDPFYSDNKDQNISSGIGLALVQSLVKLLNGKLSATSKKNEGVEFNVELPLIENPPKEYILSNTFVKKKVVDYFDSYIPGLDAANTLISKEDDSTIISNTELLIVEDDKDLSQFLSEHFSKKYKISKAVDGKDAILKINQAHPDLIISDIMMPNMNGIELCNTLKNSIETNHIPIILLTADSDAETKIEGLISGADAYLKKPFNLQELDLQIRNILKSVEDIRKKFSKLDYLDDTADCLQNKEVQFIASLSDIIIRNLDNSNYQINDLCKEAFVSRTNLHRKLKKITGLSTSEFIRNVRLNEAKKLLKTNNYTVSEVANSVGYSDPAYFSKSFKKVFKILPSNFLKECSEIE